MSRFSSLSQGRRHLPALLVAALGCAVYLVWQPPSNDLAVQDFRIELFRRAPFALWNNQWFAGHHTLAYSLLSPLFGSVLGPRLFGVTSAVVAAWLGSFVIHRLADEHDGLRWPGMAAALYALGALSSLYGGRLTFLLGVAFGTAAVLVGLRGTRWAAIVLGVCTTLASPVAGMFVAVIGCAAFCARALPRPVAVALAVSPVVPAVALAVLFPEGGSFPFPIGGLVNVLLVCAGIAAVGWRFLFVRWACLGYAAFCVLSAIPQTPIGGNAARLAALAGPPALVMLAAWAVQWVAMGLVALLVLQWSPVSLTFRQDSVQDDPEFYAPLLEAVRDTPGPQRVEVVPVATHGEADVVALEVPIARGWNRQLDRRYNSLFYEDPDETTLDPDVYFDWLVEHGVSLVAIADTELDEGGLLEQQLLEAPPDYLQLIHQDEVWRVYEVVPDPGLVTGDAVVTDLAVDTFTLTVFSGGDLRVRIRFSPWFRVTAGNACVLDDGDGWTVVRAGSRGIVRVSAVLSLTAVWDRDGDC